MGNVVDGGCDGGRAGGRVVDGDEGGGGVVREVIYLPAEFPQKDSPQ